MGSSSSSSSTTNFNDTSTTDERLAADGQALVTRSGGNTIIRQTSREAVALGTNFADAANELADAAFDLSGDIAQESLYTARDGISALERSVGSAFDFGDQAGRDAFGFAGDVNERGFDFGETSLDAVRRTADRSIDHSGETLDTALAFAEGAREEALQFAGQSLDTLSGALVTTLDQSQEDSTQLSEKIIKLGIPAVALILIAQTFKG